MSGDKPIRAPLAIDLAAKTGKTRAPVIIEAAETMPDDAAAVAAPAPLQRSRRFGWLGALLGGALVSLALLWLADAAWDLVLRLGAKNPLLGQIGLGLIVLVCVVFLLWLAREAVAILRLRRVDRLRAEIAAARKCAKEANALAAIRSLTAFYAPDATTAAARAAITRMQSDVLDGPTRLDEAERLLLQEKDDRARVLIGEAAQRVSIVTAVSPRALVDILFVLAQSFRLIRDLSALYGGRASGFGLARLATRIVGHLAITGGMAVADSALSQMVGSGLAARLSAKLGEGVLNGVLTARIGIAAAGLCRPMDFVANKPIILAEVVLSSVFQKEVAEKPAA